MELVHLEPGHVFDHFLQIIERKRHAGHVQKRASDLIGRVIPGDALGDEGFVPVGKEGLDHGDRAVEKACLLRGPDGDGIRHVHVIPFLAHFWDGGVDFQRNVSLCGCSFFDGNVSLEHFLEETGHLLGHGLFRRGVGDDGGRGGQLKFAGIAFPLLDGGQG